MAKPGEIDDVGARAYEFSIESERALKAGDVSTAKQLMLEAARLDGRYGIRAAFVDKSDERAVRVSPTLRKLVIAPLLQGGFRCREGTSWKQGTFLERQVGNILQSLLPGTEKFGGAIGMLACREVGGCVAYFDWRQSALRSGRLDYRTQAELEAVCVRWNEVLCEEVVPWLEHGDED
jgi:hypothetical protein